MEKFYRRGKQRKVCVFARAYVCLRLGEVQHSCVLMGITSRRGGNPTLQEKREESLDVSWSQQEGQCRAQVEGVVLEVHSRHPCNGAEAEKGHRGQQVSRG